jgi:hypothetical protein
MKLKNSTRELSVALLGLLLVVGVSYAGSLTPTSGTVSSQGYTLNDIYNKMVNLSYSPVVHSVSTTSSPAPSFRTLTEIYNKLNTESSLIVPGNIREGVTIFGVTGTVVPNVWDGVNWQPPLTTSATDPKYTYKLLCFRATAYELSASVVNPLINTACVPGDGLTSEGYGAQEYCANLSVPGSYTSGWRLPSRTEIEAAMARSLGNGGDGQPGGFIYYESTNSNWGPYYNSLGAYTIDDLSQINYSDILGLHHGASIRYHLAGAVNMSFSDTHQRRAVRCVHD